MVSYEEIYETICRVCLIQNRPQNLISLCDNTSDDGLSCFGKSIAILTSISLVKDDKFPKMVCRKCVNLLKQAIHFKMMCESSEQKLKNISNISVEKSENIKVIICEYVMFNHYFPPKTELKHFGSITTHKNVQNVENLRIENVQSMNDINETNMYDLDNSNGDTNHNSDDCDTKTNEDINNIINTMQDIINFDPSEGRTYQKQRSKTKLWYRTRKNERNLLCKICNRTLANSLTYNHHMQRHSNCQYICDQCGKGFPILNELHMHQIARHGIGPYLKCDICSYKAPRKITLIEHLRLHTGERPFTCEKCGLTFRRRAIWRNHLACHMEKKYQCVYCPMKFVKQSGMLAHCNNVHTRKYSYICNVCNTSYANTKTVRRHMINKHKIPREKQGNIVRITNNSCELQENSVNRIN